jgi:hypothetical protein
MAEFVKAYIESGNFTDPNFESSFYADSVDYFDNGVVSKAFFAQDVFNCDQLWPLRRVVLNEGMLRLYCGPGWAGLWYSMWPLSKRMSRFLCRYRPSALTDRMQTPVAFSAVQGPKA